MVAIQMSNYLYLHMFNPIVNVAQNISQPFYLGQIKQLRHFHFRFITTQHECLRGSNYYF